MCDGWVYRILRLVQCKILSSSIHSQPHAFLHVRLGLHQRGIVSIRLLDGMRVDDRLLESSDEVCCGRADGQLLFERDVAFQNRVPTFISKNVKIQCRNPKYRTGPGMPEVSEADPNKDCARLECSMTHRSLSKRVAILTIINNDSRRVVETAPVPKVLDRWISASAFGQYREV